MHVPRGWPGRLPRRFILSQAFVLLAWTLLSSLCFALPFGGRALEVQRQKRDQKMPRERQCWQSLSLFELVVCLGDSGWRFGAGSLRELDGPRVLVLAPRATWR